MNIIILSPHRDDETLGAAGFLLKRKSMGDNIFCISITDASVENGYDAEYVSKKALQVSKINSLYGFTEHFSLGFTPCSLESIDKDLLINAISDIFKTVKPECIILPNPTDAHSDHRIVYEAGMSCTKVFRYPFVKKVMTMEILSETDFSKDGTAFSPNYFVDITDFMDKKIEALNIYDTEMGEPPFPRSIEAAKALATLRGGMAGVRYAEAFRIIKEID